MQTKMKTTLFTQKNVCAFLGVVMALMIVFSAQAAESVDHRPVVSKVYEEIFMDLQPVIVESTSEFPSVTFLDKNGKVVAEFYGEKEELEKKFPESFQQVVFLTAYGKHEFYLVK
jgi:hypothetical protein